MPLCTLHLVALNPAQPNAQQSFLSALKSAKISPLVLSRVIRWIIVPSTFSLEHLLARNIHWDFLLILDGSDALPSSLQSHIQHTWTVTAGVPSRLIQDFAAKNRKLLDPEPHSVPNVSSDVLETKQATSSAQNLELSSELKDWARAFSNGQGKEAKGAVSMFNLLSFQPGKKASYLEYGKAFATSIGSSHGGNAKIVGAVTDIKFNGSPREKTAGDGSGWDEIALAHYPSILHFVDMLSDPRYQEVNHKYRLPALKDTAILMTSEVACELEGEERLGARL